MANIGQWLNDIRNAVFGREVRGAIHDGINAINEETEATTELVNEQVEIIQELAEETENQLDTMQEQIDNLVIADGHPDAEAAQARTNADGFTFDTLRDRLNDSDTRLNAETEQIETHANAVVASVNGVHGMRFYNDKLEYNDGSNWVEIQTGDIFHPKNVIDPVAYPSAGKITVTWGDPGDTSVEEQTMVVWAGTKLVMNSSNYPSDVNDGTLVVDNTVKDQYKTTGVEISGVLPGTTKYFQLFPYSDKGAINTNEVNRLNSTLTVDRQLLVSLNGTNSSSLDRNTVLSLSTTDLSTIFTADISSGGSARPFLYNQPVRYDEERGLFYTFSGGTSSSDPFIFYEVSPNLTLSNTINTSLYNTNISPESFFEKGGNYYACKHDPAGDDVLDIYNVATGSIVRSVPITYSNNSSSASLWKLSEDKTRLFASTIYSATTDIHIIDISNINSATYIATVNNDRYRREFVLYDTYFLVTKFASGNNNILKYNLNGVLLNTVTTNMPANDGSLANEPTDKLLGTDSGGNYYIYSDYYVNALANSYVLNKISPTGTVSYSNDLADYDLVDDTTITTALIMIGEQLVWVGSAPAYSVLRINKDDGTIDQTRNLSEIVDYHYTSDGGVPAVTLMDTREVKERS
jgi:hypothetical protein